MADFSLETPSPPSVKYLAVPFIRAANGAPLSPSFFLFSMLSLAIFPSFPIVINPSSLLAIHRFVDSSFRVTLGWSNGGLRVYRWIFDIRVLTPEGVRISLTIILKLNDLGILESFEGLRCNNSELLEFSKRY